LHIIVMLRQVHHGPTRAYTSRRIAQGKSEREIRRCLKRSLARQLYRLLERTAINHAAVDAKESISQPRTRAAPSPKDVS
jgi:transposase